MCLALHSHERIVRAAGCPGTALGIPEQKLDPTFIASVFTGVLATFGVQAGKKAGAAGGISKADLQKLIDAAAQTAPSQTIRIEQPPLVLGPKTDAKTD